METITFTCKILTPMFLAGADGKTPELRAPSIKGAMRFWWRAVNGHLSLEQLRNRETAIFGGVNGPNAGRSKVIVRVSSHNPLRTSQEMLVPHRDRMNAKAFTAGQQFQVILTMPSPIAGFDSSHLQALFELTCLLGGFGKRVRRGMGSVSITNIEVNRSVHEPTPASLEGIYSILAHFSSRYSLSGDSIHFNHSGESAKYPYLKQIQIGEPGSNAAKILRGISDATHTTKQNNPRKYEASMGHAFRGRFASPIYVSTVEGSIKLIISSLNTAPERGEDQVSALVQEEFKKKIL